MHKLRSKVKRLFYEIEKNPTSAKIAEHRNLKSKLRNDIKKAKRKSWQKFIESINDPKSMALLNKVIKGPRNEQLGILKDPTNGRFVSGLNESLALLMKTHFPDSENVADISVSDINESIGSSYTNSNISYDKDPFLKKEHKRFFEKLCSKDDLRDSIITEEAVKLAINSFGPNRAPGADLIKPIMLLNVPDTYIRRLTWLYRAILKLGYTPYRWRYSRTVFIPKPGKSDYSDPKAWRPITLSSYYIKILERIVYWHLEQTVLKDKPLSRFQHAFVKMKSTTTALSGLVDEIEKSILREKFHIGLFLDISGAFDNLKQKSIISAMKERQFPDDIVNWFEQNLMFRTTFTEIKGTFCAVNVKRGCAQGAILSPLSFNLVFESFIKMFDNSAINTSVYADDCVLHLSSICPSTIVNIVQQGIEKALEWSKEHDLSFAPSKTVAMLFHRKKLPKNVPKLKMGDHIIEYSTHTKHLGCFLDEKLNFKIHLTKKIESVKKHLYLLRNAIGSIWGPSPRALKWAYNTVILSSLCYGSVVWARTAQAKQFQDKLEKLNRLCALTMMPARKSTPTAGLEMILDMKPLDLKIEESALKALTQVLPQSFSKWDGMSTTTPSSKKMTFGHLRWGIHRLQSMGVYSKCFDQTNELNLNKGYEVDLESFKSGLPESSTEVCVYTDGSKMTSNAGFGYGVSCGMEMIAEGNGQLGKNNSVFQAEILGIKAACDDITNSMNLKEVTFFSDSQAAIAALNDLKVKSKTVLSCVKSLNFLGQSCKIQIKWIKAHCGHPGNEFADYAAKVGTTNSNNRFDIKPPMSWAKNKIAQFINKIWIKRWTNLTDCRQTRIWFPSPNKNQSRILTNQSRRDLGLLVQMITGHNRLRRHESLINPNIDPICRWCNEDEETSWHVISECPALWRARRTVFGYHLIQNPPQNWHVRNLQKFLQVIGMEQINSRCADPAAP